MQTWCLSEELYVVSEETFSYVYQPNGYLTFFSELYPPLIEGISMNLTLLCYLQQCPGVILDQQRLHYNAGELAALPVPLNKLNDRTGCSEILF